MPMIPVTGLYTAIFTFLLLGLAYGVVRQRIKLKKALGHDHPDLQIANRAHANAVEYVPIALLLMGIAELNGASNNMLHLLGLTLLVARVAHAWGFTASKDGVHAGRYWGTVVTWLVLVLLALVNLLLGFPFYLL
ncbi:MAG: MAPEG family protein [Oceanospirillaceae bacterium]|nr:MAPEG family protein [Oceanospirillaceae bacterium]MCP5350680.1 MAPEG family protein [Oceanospirillaceae bacterium]